MVRYSLATDPKWLNRQVRNERQSIIHRFGPFLDDLASDGYDIHALLDHWEQSENDFSPLATMLLTPTGESTTLSELAQRHGTRPDFIQRAWRALGFVSDEVTDGDGPVIELLAAAEAGFGEPSALQIASVMGRNAQRLAEAELSEVRVQREVPVRLRGSDDIAFAYEVRALAGTYLPMSAAADEIVHRRHLILGAAKTWAIDAEDSSTMVEQTIGFTDLAGFTARTIDASPAELLDLVRTFESTVSNIVIGGHGRVVKLIGDGVMFATVSASGACDISLRLREAFTDQDLVIRSGLALGAVLNHGGDFYGQTVNLASRLASLAEQGQILTGASLPAAAPTHQFRSVGPTSIRGLEHREDCWELLHVG